MELLFKDVIGHRKQCDYLAQIIKSENIAHAYCFSGSKGLGKAGIAKEFVGSLLNLHKDKILISPNITIISDHDGAIKVEQIRELKHTLSLSAFGDGWKVAIIDGANKMTIQAQNALLKTLEEPTDKTILILISHNSNLLLKTIKSRVAMIEFHLLLIDDISKMLQEKFQIEKEKAEFVSYMSMGRPGNALIYLQADQFDVQKEKSIEALEFLKVPLYKRMKMIEVIVKNKETRKQNIENMVELWKIWLYYALGSHFELMKMPEVEQISNLYSIEEIHKALIELSVCENALTRNVQPALALQVFASSF